MPRETRYPCIYAIKDTHGEKDRPYSLGITHASGEIVDLPYEPEEPVPTCGLTDKPCEWPGYTAANCEVAERAGHVEPPYFDRIVLYGYDEEE